MRFSIYLVFFLSIIVPNCLSAQTGSIIGELDPAVPNIKVALENSPSTTLTDEFGKFRFDNLPYGNYTILVYTKDVNNIERFPVSLINEGLYVPISLKGKLGDAQNSEDVAPTISIGETDSDGSGSDQNVSGLLTATRDAFTSAMAFNFSAFRYRARGYRPENTSVYINGVPMNDPENGGVFWSIWGGLNDVTRLQQTSYGLLPMAFSFGGLGGGTNIDLRPSHQRKQIRASYALSNRTYNHRAMVTWSTGLMKGGWAITASGSRRWADEGYVPGTFYDGWSYYLGVEKRLGRKHSLTLSAFGAPTISGRAYSTTAAMFDLANTNYYNPGWGWQSGKKRNANVSHTHQPVTVLTHEWKPTSSFTLTTSASFLFGQNGLTGLNWNDARDPRPDYYRNLPDYVAVVDPQQAALVEQALRDNESLRQLNWDYFYNTNRNSLETITDVNGIPGNNVTGNRARYIIEDRRTDSKKFNLGSYFEAAVSDRLTVNGGAYYQWFQGQNYQKVDDLLGADYWLDIDRFSVGDSVENIDPDFYQNDLSEPNKIVREGDKYGYNYNSNIHKGGVWAQAILTYNHFDIFMSMNASYTTFWRKGNVQNGRFPDNSLGKSPEQHFFNNNIKAGVTYKINGRNYLYANGTFGTRAPFFRNAYVSPRVRDEVLPNISNEKIYGGEISYALRAPSFKLRFTGYYTRIDNQFWSRSFYLDNIVVDQNTTGGFVNYIMSGVDHEYRGLEAAVEAKVGTTGLTVRAAASMGQFTYASRPNVRIQLDNDPTVNSTRVAYIENFHLGGTPENAYTVALSYNSDKFWFVNLSVNYANNLWFDINPDRRTVEAVSDNGQTPEYIQQALEPGSALFHQIIDQTKAKGGVTVDFFGGKSWKFGKVFLYLNAGVNNIFNNQNITVSGREQLRFDYQDKQVSKFPNQSFNMFGTNYFVSLSVKY